jgi:hypothetical protein
MAPCAAYRKLEPSAFGKPIQCHGILLLAGRRPMYSYITAVAATQGGLATLDPWETVGNDSNLASKKFYRAHDSQQVRVA